MKTSRSISSKTCSIARADLLGLSGISPDMKVLLDSDRPEAKEAVDYYCYSAARHAASLVPAMNGADAVIFTGGVGENAEACARENHGASGLAQHSQFIRTRCTCERRAHHCAACAFIVVT